MQKMMVCAYIHTVDFSQFNYWSAYITISLSCLNHWLKITWNAIIIVIAQEKGISKCQMVCLWLANKLHKCL